MFEHHGSLFHEPIKDIIQSRSTRSTYLTNSFNDALARIRITLDILESNYKYINELLKKAKGKFLRRIYNILIYKTYIYMLRTNM